MTRRLAKFCSFVLKRRAIWIVDSWTIGREGKPLPAKCIERKLSSNDKEDMPNIRYGCAVLHKVSARIRTSYWLGKLLYSILKYREPNGRASASFHEGKHISAS